MNYMYLDVLRKGFNELLSRVHCEKTREQLNALSHRVAEISVDAAS